MNPGDRPWFQTRLDYLTATNPRGFLHASTCDSPPGFGKTFQATMERQGMTVTRYSPGELQALRASHGWRPPQVGPR